MNRTYLDLLLALNEIKMMMPPRWRQLFDGHAIRGLKTKPSFDAVGCQLDIYQRRYNQRTGHHPLNKCASYTSTGLLISLVVCGNGERMTIDIWQRTVEDGLRLEYDIRVTRTDINTAGANREWLEQFHKKGWAYDTDPPETSAGT